MTVLEMLDDKLVKNRLSIVTIEGTPSEDSSAAHHNIPSSLHRHLPQCLL